MEMRPRPNRARSGIVPVGMRIPTTLWVAWSLEPPRDELAHPVTRLELVMASNDEATLERELSRLGVRAEGLNVAKVPAFGFDEPLEQGTSCDATAVVRVENRAASSAARVRALIHVAAVFSNEGEADTFLSEAQRSQSVAHVKAPCVVRAAWLH